MLNGEWALRDALRSLGVRATQGRVLHTTQAPDTCRGLLCDRLGDTANLLLLGCRGDEVRRPTQPAVTHLHGFMNAICNDWIELDTFCPIYYLTFYLS